MLRLVPSASDAAKTAKAAIITLAPKAAFRPHKLKIKLSGHMVRDLVLSSVRLSCSQPSAFDVGRRTFASISPNRAILGFKQ